MKTLLHFTWLVLSYLVVLASAQSLKDVLQAHGLTNFLDGLQQVAPSLLTPPPGSKLIVYAPSNDAADTSGSITRRGDDDDDDDKNKSDDKNKTAKYQFLFSNANAPVLGRRQTGGSSLSASVFQTLLDDPEYVNLGAGKNQSIVQKGSVVFSGLGAQADILSADIPFDGGVVRPVDEYV